MDDDALPRHLRLILILLLCAVAFAALFGWFGQADGGATFLIVGLVSIIAIPVGGLILLAIFVLLARDGWRIGSARSGRARWFARSAAPVALVLAFASLVFVPDLFSGLHRQQLLSENRALFDDAMRQGATQIALTNGEKVPVTPASAGRYYFAFSGMGDNHQGFVYDHSGQVAQAQGWANGEAGRFTAPDRVKELFGGDMLRCTQVRGDWFYCSFT